MKSRLLLLIATSSLSCVAQLHLTDVRDAEHAAHEIQPATTAAPNPNDFPLPITFPPLSPIVENGALSLVIDTSAVMTRGRSSGVTELPNAAGVSWRVSDPDVSLTTVTGDKRSVISDRGNSE